MSKSLLAALVLSLFVGIGAVAEEVMKPVAMATTIGEGSDQEVVKLYESAWTKLVQITLRNGKTLSRHEAKEAITIQCVSGEGVLVLGEERIALTPGVIVPLEPNVPHAVEAKPAVSVLVTRFLPPAGDGAEHRH
ncbi:MAG: AraC family ligand binding domain-containing protein [Thermoanaerobaculia bacterium]